MQQLEFVPTRAAIERIIFVKALLISVWACGSTLPAVIRRVVHVALLH